VKVHLIKKKTIEEFAAGNARSKVSLQMWLGKIKAADWSEPADMVKTFAAADLLGKGSNRVVFDIAGNNYRIICKYWFGANAVWLYVKWIGTHAEYDALCKKNKQYNVEDY